eukprot:Hpha_TRINITY_DN19377_c0_g1::TRINITY_DN19377_c0_g1_i1::g.81286::m.81286
MKRVLLLAAALALARAAAPEEVVVGGVAVWHPGNKTLRFCLLRSPEFTLPASPSRAVLRITARQSPRIPVKSGGTSQSKLLGAYDLTVNGMRVTAGPGHTAWYNLNAQPVNEVDVSHLLRPPPARNVVGIASFFENSTEFPSEVPRVQAELIVGNTSVVKTSP